MSSMEEELRQARSDAATAAEAGQALLASLAQTRQDKEDALQQVHDLKLSLDASRTMVDSLTEEMAILKADQAKAISLKDEEISGLKKSRSAIQEETGQTIDNLVQRAECLTKELEAKSSVIQGLQLELKESLSRAKPNSAEDDRSRKEEAEERAQLLEEKVRLQEAELCAAAETRESLLKVYYL